MKFAYSSVRIDTNDIDTTLPVMYAVHHPPQRTPGVVPAPLAPREVMYLGEGDKHWLLVSRQAMSYAFNHKHKPIAALFHAPKDEYKLYPTYQFALEGRNEHKGVGGPIE